MGLAVWVGAADLNGSLHPVPQMHEECSFLSRGLRTKQALHEFLAQGCVMASANATSKAVRGKAVAIHVGASFLNMVRHWTVQRCSQQTHEDLVAGLQCT